MERRRGFAGRYLSPPPCAVAAVRALQSPRSRKPPVPLQRFATELDDYARRWPDEAVVVEAFRSLLADGPRAFTRERLDGHFTGSAWLVSADGERALLTHHRKLGLWLQPGGHADGDIDLGAVALREAQEESGLAQLVLRPGLFDIDRHLIPARGDVPAHWHHDARLVVRCTGEETFAVGPESFALAWRNIADLVDAPGIDASVQRMARKWLARGDE